MKSTSPKLVFLCIPLVIACMLLPLSCGTHSVTLRESERIVFLGDSITELGEKPGGYVAVVRDSLLKQIPGLTVIGAGISGNKVTDLQARLDRDVLSKHPTIVVIYIGINDVWHFALNGHGTTKDLFESGLRDIISRIQKASARVILCTPSVIGEKHHGDNSLDAQLDEYSDISRRVAENLGATLCDLRKAFIDHLRTNNPENKDRGVLTMDSVHLNDAGNRFVAAVILETLRR